MDWTVVNFTLPAGRPSSTFHFAASSSSIYLIDRRSIISKLGDDVTPYVRSTDACTYYIYIFFWFLSISLIYIYIYISSI
jgi:hypothetical protein